MARTVGMTELSLEQSGVRHEAALKLFSKKDNFLALLHMAVVTALYGFLASSLMWDGITISLVSPLFLVCISLSLFWNLGYSVTLYRSMARSR